MNGIMLCTLFCCSSSFISTLFWLNSLQVEVIPNCSILAAVGQRMASTPGVSATLFDALAKVFDIISQQTLCIK